MKKTIFTLFVVIISTFTIFGQCEIETNPQEKIDCENREQRKKIHTQLKEQRQLFIPTLTNYLPKGENTWLLSLVQQGGWDGMTKIKSTITSDRHFICNNNNSFIKSSLFTDKFDEFTNLVNKTSFSFLQPNYDSEAEIIEEKQPTNFGQLSVAETTLIVLKNESVISKKGKKDTNFNTYKFKMRDFADENSLINKISKSMLESANCSDKN